MDITAVTIATIVTSGVVFLGAFSTWLRHRAGRAARADRPDRLERLAEDVRAPNTSLEALGLEVESLGEARRHTLRLLDARGEPLPPSTAAADRALPPREPPP